MPNEQTIYEQLDAILNEICTIFKHDPNDIRKHRGRMDVINCKRLFCYASTLLIRNSMTTIASFLGFPCHTTVSHHCKKMKYLLNNKDADTESGWNTYTSKSKIWKKHFPDSIYKENLNIDDNVKMLVLKSLNKSNTKIGAYLLLGITEKHLDDLIKRYNIKNINGKYVIDDTFPDTNKPVIKRLKIKPHVH